MFSIFIISALSVDTVNSIKRQISKKQFNQAFQAANSIILQQGTIDAQNILFFLRGHASVKIGKYSQGISDISRFLRSEKNINPNDQKEAYILRGTAYLNLGNLADAKNDAESSKDELLIKLVKRASSLLNSARSNESTPQFSLNKYTELIKICSSSEVFMREAANIALQIGNNTLFLELSQKALTISPKDAKLLEMMGKYHFSNAEFIVAQKHTRTCINSASDASKCTEILKAINNFQTNENEAVAAVAKKKFDKAQGHIDLCQSIAKKYSKPNSPLSNRIKGVFVKVLLAKNKKEEAIGCLNDLIKASPKNNELIIQRGELLLDLGDYSGALEDFQIVKKRTRPNTSENQKVIKLIEKASNLQEKEKNVDYYTVLGLKHGASMDDVKKAYRKLVVQWHPDRFKESLKKKEAEKKMKMINRAYDVLSDAEKKRMYDMGQDPDNQMPNEPPPNSNPFSNFKTFKTNNGGRQTFFSFSTSGDGHNFDHGFFDQSFGAFGGAASFGKFAQMFMDSMWGDKDNSGHSSSKSQSSRRSYSSHSSYRSSNNNKNKNNGQQRKRR